MTQFIEQGQYGFKSGQSFMYALWEIQCLMSYYKQKEELCLYLTAHDCEKCHCEYHLNKRKKAEDWTKFEVKECEKEGLYIWLLMIVKNTSLVLKSWFYVGKHLIHCQGQ